VKRVPAEVWFLLVLGALPLVSLAGHPDALLADAYSEYPIKLWCFENFRGLELLGGRADGIAFPHGGILNNPDPTGTLVTALLRPLVGRVAAYNLLVMLQLQATLLATWALVADLTGSRRSAVLAAAAFTFTPLVLVYCVAGAVTDMLNLWPYPMAIRAFLRGGVRGGAEAGVWASIGLLTCPYNVVVFATMAVPAVLFVPLWGRGVGRGSLPATLAGLLLTVVPLGGATAWHLRTLTNAEDAQVSVETIAETRHVEPYPFLEPEMPDRYTAYLVDYVAVGKDALIEREAGSRYYRAFSPGLSLFALALVGLLARPRQAGLHAAMAAWSVLASLGPFAPLFSDISTSLPANPAWLVSDALVPGADLLLEPFRYGLGAALGLAVCAAIGLDWLGTRLGRWVAPAGVALWLAELVWVSPVPIPLPVNRPEIPAIYHELPLPPGAVVELPFFDRGTDRFRRVHFLHQLAHRRPIPDEVIGSPPRAYEENQFLAALLAAEKPLGRIRIEVTRPDQVESDRLALGAQGYAGFVVDPSGFANGHRRDAVLALLEAALGSPVYGDRVRVYPVPQAGRAPLGQEADLDVQ